MRTPRTRAEPARIADADYEALATFRRALRQFLAFSESAARAAGIPPRQHQALLAIRGRAGGPPVTVGRLAKDLLIAPHSAAELVDRLVAAGLLAKSKPLAERRRVELSLTDRADEVLRSLSEAHLAELRTIGPQLIRQLQAIQKGRD
ncbi:MAG TPA: MarR family winged helix-turn-helix transcriptional regulator [Dongiaceae bacterium]|jgi:DNA-binding MarR family transcriptional regulator|nr:MarR family winged helix-turn-helix transcriptional regulator [Dongiaceae bacterium]HSE75350.1 MarR family winged helix-turn-helix transcriptional regulator [Dongiaceae bacterium]